MHVDQKQMLFKVKSSNDKSEQFICIEEPNRSSDATSTQMQSANKTKVTVELSLELLLKNSQKQKSKIAWALKVNGFSDNSCTDLGKTFRCMYPESKIA